MEPYILMNFIEHLSYPFIYLSGIWSASALAPLHNNQVSIYSACLNNFKKLIA